VILEFDQLKDYRGRVAMVDGAFDPLHAGHIEYFRAAAAAVDVPLLCNVASDRYVRTKHTPLLPEDQPATIVDAIRHVTYTHINRFDTETILRELRPKYYVKGNDWEGRLPPEQIGICAELGIGVVYLDSVRDSSTRILEQFLLEKQSIR
jgi:cytidyltransferase-like protein